jgi:hypothetical protein
VDNGTQGYHSHNLTTAFVQVLFWSTVSQRLRRYYWAALVLRIARLRVSQSVPAPALSGDNIALHGL